MTSLFLFTEKGKSVSPQRQLLFILQCVKYMHKADVNKVERAKSILHTFSRGDEQGTELTVAAVREEVVHPPARPLVH